MGWRRRSDPSFIKNETVKIADAAFPNGTLVSLSLPTSETGVYIVGKRTDDEPSKSSARNKIGTATPARTGDPQIHNLVL